jgi:hypothetical protein
MPLKDILSPLRDALRDTAGRLDLAMNEVDRTSASRSLYALTGPGTVPAQTDRKCMLNQLFPKTNPELWLGILLELKKRTREVPGAPDRYEFFHVSVQAFEGTTSQSIEPLLRAEWDPTVARSQEGPAQPHWHAYSAKYPLTQQGFMDEASGQFEDRIRPGGSNKQRQHKIHFALCANWHKKDGSEFEVLSTPEELKRWVIGTLQYIKSQV